MSKSNVRTDQSRPRLGEAGAAPLPLIRFAVLHFSLGMVVGIILAAALIFGGTESPAYANPSPDRLLCFFVLAMNLGSVLGISSLATALHFAAEDD
jgi:hypothetical protein